MKSVFDKKRKSSSSQYSEEEHEEHTSKHSKHAKTSMKVRYLTFIEGSSDKFYEVSQDGRSVTFRYGRNGSDGITSTKTYSTVDEATKQANKIVSEKLDKGYVEENCSVEDGENKVGFLSSLHCAVIL